MNDQRQTQQFFYQRAVQSSRIYASGSVEEEYSSGEEVETEGERNERLTRARAEIQERIAVWKETKWKDKKPSLKLPAAKFKPLLTKPELGEEEGTKNQAAERGDLAIKKDQLQ